MTLSAGTKLGPYEVLSPLGARKLSPLSRRERVGVRGILPGILPERPPHRASAPDRGRREAAA
jgi:hypothetical protein